MSSITTPPGARQILVTLACGNQACPCQRAAAMGHGRTHCVAHADTVPSLSVEERDGRVLVHCHGGCDQERVVAALLHRGLWPERPRRELTIEELAAAKKLPTEFLRSLGVRTVYVHEDARVQIPYQDSDGNVVAVRSRLSMGKDFLWRSGDKTVLYGLARLDAIHRAGWVLLVEGETDSWTAWMHDLPALGIPGKSTWKTEWAPHLTGLKVYVWQEPGAEDLVARIAHDIPGVLVIKAPEGTKDISEAHVRGEDVGELVSRLCLKAQPALRDGDIEPWTEPVDGVSLVHEIEQLVVKYLVLPTWAPIVLALWSAGTWLAEEFEAFPYLALTSPQKRCGKTRTLKIMRHLCRNPLVTSNISESALFRSIDDGDLTLIIDEAQHLRQRDERSSALHDILCAGVEKGSVVLRVGGEHHDRIDKFSVYCPKIMALIGRLTDILMDRAIEVGMKRRKKSERISRFLTARVKDEAEPLRRRLARWSADYAEAVREAYVAPDLLPEWLEDRQADLWGPILAAARVAVPDRVEEIERTAKALSEDKAADDDSTGVRLLGDVCTVFREQGFLPTKEIIAALVAIGDAPWSEHRGGKPLTDRGLADLLRPFGIEPGKARHDGQVGVRGYFRDAFRDAWERYLPAPPPVAAPNPPQAPQPLQDKGLLPILEAPQTPPVADGEIVGNSSGTRLVADVADKSAPEGGVREDEPPAGDHEGRRVWLKAMFPNRAAWIATASPAEIEAAIQEALAEEGTLPG